MIAVPAEPGELLRAEIGGPSRRILPTFQIVLDRSESPLSPAPTPEERNFCLADTSSEGHGRAACYIGHIAVPTYLFRLRQNYVIAGRARSCDRRSGPRPAGAHPGLYGGRAGR